MDGTTAIKIDYYEELKKKADFVDKMISPSANEIYKEFEELKAKADKWDEKETPLKVIVDEIYDCFSEESHEKYRCPKCNSYSFPDENYCSNCAQRLDWKKNK